jgi:hypothetical protein
MPIRAHSYSKREVIQNHEECYERRGHDELSIPTGEGLGLPLASVTVGGCGKGFHFVVSFLEAFLRLGLEDPTAHYPSRGFALGFS